MKFYLLHHRENGRLIGWALRVGRYAIVLIFGIWSHAGLWLHPQSWLGEVPDRIPNAE